MVRIIPSRLKSFNGASQPVSRSSSPLRSAAPTLVLRTTVLRGRNLAAKDRSGTSDPFLVVTLGDIKQSTQPMYKTLNPEWHVSFDLAVLGPQSLLLEAVCWDKDRFGKDYLGEFDVAVEDIFVDGSTAPEWYVLQSKRSEGKKDSQVSGEIQLQFALIDIANPVATPEEILRKFLAITSGGSESPGEANGDLELSGSITRELEDEDEEITTDEAGEPAKPETVEKRRRKLKLAKLKKNSKARAYEFTGGTECVGIAYLEISRITDLPPERNVTRTSFDMDPFVVASLGRKTYRTRVIRHNLNPTFDERMIFQVMRHEQQYSISFAVVDRDKLSGNDFIGTASFPLSTIISVAPEADPETGLYSLVEPRELTPAPTPGRSRFKVPMSRSSSTNSGNKSPRPSLPSRSSSNTLSSVTDVANQPNGAPAAAADPNYLSPVPSHAGSIFGDDQAQSSDDPDLKSFVLPVELKHRDKWNDRHSTQLYIKAKYLPYRALRQQFWRAMLKQYDADESGTVSKVELTTMLDTLGSTLKETTIDRFFQRFSAENEQPDANPPALTLDQAIICLEDELQRSQKKSAIESFKESMHSHGSDSRSTPDQVSADARSEKDDGGLAVPTISVDFKGKRGEAGEVLPKDDLADEGGEEHVIEIRECPICHQPRLNKRSDADIVTHVATCASQDWRQVNNIVMAGFVTSSQAQRKWYSKVITKISYGGYKLGANSANILVQDRLTGQINEERMSVYVRLGIRLLYKGLKSRDMETKRIRKLLKSLSFKQGRKYDDPASVSQIQGFINFHKLDMSEVLLPTDQFKTFNEFFYRALKPGARPCSAPDNPRIIVSPADSRTVVFNKIEEATSIWIKGRGFSVERLLGNAYPEDAKRYVNGALGIFRLAPQDYHRFHVPVDGIMDKPKLIEGEYYTVNPMAIRSALDVYGENVRVVVPIDSTTHGRVMVICVGAMMVGSTVITRKAGEKVSRAEELGYFKFGGSTLVLLFEPGVMKFDDDLTENSSGALETLVRVGMSIGHHPNQAQHTPDMKKKDECITLEDRQEAKRRIEGSLAPAASERSANLE